MSAKDYFIEGPIRAEFIADQISNHSSKKNIGGHAIFLGQVRADIKNGKIVKKINYSAYREMANKEISKLREEAFSLRDLTCLHIYHSLGDVLAGEISLFIFASSAHRKEAIECMTEIIEKFKTKVPIWKKEVLEDNSASWVE